MLQCTGGNIMVAVTVGECNQSRTLTADGMIDHSAQTWLLEQTTPKPDESDYVAQLQDGCHVGQTVTIMIPGNISNNTAPWRVMGNLAGWDHLRFTNIGNSAFLSWSGASGGWVLLGGNSQPVNQP